MRLTTRAAAILALATFGAAIHGTAVRASGRSLLSQAVKNTDNALSYREADTVRLTVGGASMSSSAWEIYDQRHNRERDHDHFTIVRPGGQTLRYVVDVAMLDHRTYYRTTLDHAGWRMRSGYGYTDPVTGDRWIRSPLIFSYLNHTPVASEEHAANSTLHIRFHLPSSLSGKATGRIDVWISTHGAPFIARYSERLSERVQGKKSYETSSTRLSDFNQPVTIAAPRIGRDRHRPGLPRMRCPR